MIPTHADPIQNEIEAKGLNAPRVRPEDLEAEIASEHYFTGRDAAIGQHTTEGGVVAVMRPNTVENGRRSADALSRLTFCVLVLKNGITVTDQSACVSPKNFDVDIGRKVARQNAVAQLWPLLGFRLADTLARGTVVNLSAHVNA